ncbi:hypothetical protein GCM10008997_06470 [Halomonas salifodinae]
MEGSQVASPGKAARASSILSCSRIKGMPPGRWPGSGGHRFAAVPGRRGVGVAGPEAYRVEGSQVASPGKTARASSILSCSRIKGMPPGRWPGSGGHRFAAVPGRRGVGVAGPEAYRMEGSQVASPGKAARASSILSCSRIKGMTPR